MSQSDQQSARSVPPRADGGRSQRRGVVWWRVPVVAFLVWLLVTTVASCVVPPRSLDTWGPLLLAGMAIGVASGGRAARVRRVGDWAICVVVACFTIVVFGYSLFVVIVMLLPRGG